MKKVGKLEKKCGKRGNDYVFSIFPPPQKKSFKILKGPENEVGGGG